MYKINLKPSVQKDLDELPVEAVNKIFSHLTTLSNNPRPFGIQKLSSKIEEYRLRVGRYRILFEIDDKENRVNIFRIKHRKEAYRRK